MREDSYLYWNHPSNPELEKDEKPVFECMRCHEVYEDEDRHREYCDECIIKNKEENEY